MVLGFLIQTISSDTDVVPSVCYWEPYGFVAEKQRNNITETNNKEKICLNYILSRVQAEYIFRKEVTETNADVQEEALKEKNEHGIFRMSGYDFLSNECYVLWQTMFGCAFLLILSPTENTPLAELVLSQLVSYITSSFNILEEGLRQLSTYPEKIAAVTHIFLPAGQLLVMNHKVVRQFQKDLEKIFAEKL